MSWADVFGLGLGMLSGNSDISKAIHEGIEVILRLEAQYMRG